MTAFPDQRRLKIWREALQEGPQVDESAYVAPSAELLGKVVVKAKASVWPGAILRADLHEIVVGEESNVQDGCVLHLADDFGVEIGARVSIGHRAVIHACQLQDEVLVGMGAIVMDGAVVGRQAMVAAGAVVPKGMEVPEGSLVVGTPARVVRELSVEEREGMVKLAAKYVALAEVHAVHAALKAVASEQGREEG